MFRQMKLTHQTAGPSAKIYSPSDDDDQAYLIPQTIPAELESRQPQTQQKHKCRLWYRYLFPIATVFCLSYIVYASITTFILHRGRNSDRKTVLLVSLDGFRAEYLGRGLTRTIEAWAQNGVRAEYMQASFPSTTFPEHYTLVTGLYPESHGIVSNVFYDPVLKQTFNYTSPLSNNQSIWWLGEPIWVTAVKNGLKAFTAGWPGSEAPIKGIHPTKYLVYNNSMTVDERVDIVLNWLLPTQDRPDFLSLYIPDVDHTGHIYGPLSEQVNTTLQTVDSSLARLSNTLKTANLLDQLNIILVSDHGMTETSKSRLIYLDDYLDLRKVVIRDMWVVLMLDVADEADSESVYRILKNASIGRNFTIYQKHEVPALLHFSNSQRIPNIIGIPDIGYHFTTREIFPPTTAPPFQPHGAHGYSPFHTDMHAIFIGSGPAFKKMKGSVVPPFENVELYGMMCKLMGLQPARNNGTWKAIKWADELAV